MSTHWSHALTLPTSPKCLFAELSKGFCIHPEQEFYEVLLFHILIFKRRRRPCLPLHDNATRQPRPDPRTLSPRWKASWSMSSFRLVFPTPYLSRSWVDAEKWCMTIEELQGHLSVGSGLHPNTEALFASSSRYVRTVFQLCLGRQSPKLSYPDQAKYPQTTAPNLRCWSESRIPHRKSRRR